MPDKIWIAREVKGETLYEYSDYTATRIACPECEGSGRVACADGWGKANPNPTTTCVACGGTKRGIFRAVRVSELKGNIWEWRSTYWKIRR